VSHLNLSSTDTSDNDLIEIGKNTSIEMLDLDCTDITDQGLAHLAPLKYLSQLRLKDNPQLTDACITHLTVFNWLELLHIENTSITIDGMRRLLGKVKLETLIVGAELDEGIEALRQLSGEFPETEILVKGKCVIKGGAFQT
jgi:hypothetical protein